MTVVFKIRLMLLLVTMILGTSVSGSTSSSTNADTKPHIVFVVVDDHGWFDSSFTGSRTHTPTIDKFAKGGLRMMSSYVQKVCSPTRTAIMTSRYPHRMGMQSPFCGGTAMGLNLNETLMPQYLKTAGYISHAVGKWHLGFTSWEHTPTFRGYESFYGYYGCAEDYFSHSVPLRNATYGLDFHDDNQPNCGANCSRPAWEAAISPDCYLKSEAKEQQCTAGEQRMCYACNDWEHYSTHLITMRGQQVINAHPVDHPLFLYLPLQDTHGPAEVPSNYRERAPAAIIDPVRRELAGKLIAVDEAIENITNTLEAKQMLSNTILICTTDNGGPIVPTTGIPDDAIGASNWPLRGGKHNPYEGGVRGVAWLWDGRGKLHPRGTNDAQYHGLFHAVDWLPTLCAIAGCDLSISKLPLDGLDHSASITANSTSPRTSVVLDIEKPTQAHPLQGVVRIGDWKLMLGSFSGRPGDWSNPQPWLNVTGSEPTLPYGPAQLFNVIEDPTERKDRINDSTVDPSIITALKNMYKAEAAHAVYPFTLGPEGHPNAQGWWEPWLNNEDFEITSKV